jgi:hypothetical protein
MSKYMIVFVTAEKCEACHQTRGDGIIKNGTILMKPETLFEFLKNDIELINVHHKVMNNASKYTIKNISKIYLQKGKIVQERFYESVDKNLRLDVYNENGVKIFNDFVFKENREKISWFQFLNDRIPNKLSNYIAYFPCFMIVERSNWAETLINPKEELVALTNVGITYKDKNGNIALEKTQESFERNVDIISLLKDIIDGKEKLEPLKNLEVKEKEVKEVKEKEVKKEIPMENFIEYKDVVIKSYED